MSEPVLIPAAHVSCVDADEGVWQAADGEPRFDLPALARWRGRWVRIRAVIDVLDIDPGWPELYFDRGRGYFDKVSVPLPRERGDVRRIDHLVFVPRDLRAAQLQPAGPNVRFALRDVSVNGVHRYAAAARMLWQFATVRGFIPAAACVRDQLLYMAGLREAWLSHPILNRWEEMRLGVGSSYADWLAMFEPRPERYAVLPGRREHWPSRPTITLILAVDGATAQAAMRTVESLLNQEYGGWELVVTPVSDEPDIERLKGLSGPDPRIKVIPVRDRAPASIPGEALQAATGGHVGLLSPGGLLHPLALHFLAEALSRRPETGLAYCDEDTIMPSGTRVAPRFLPDFNYELFLSGNESFRLSVFRKDLLARADCPDGGSIETLRYDLTLRVIEKLQAGQIVHVPRVLYHAPGAQDADRARSAEASRFSVRRHLERIGARAVVTEAPGFPAASRLRYALPGPSPLVSIVVLTRDRADLLRRCLDSIGARTTYRDYEVIVMDNGSSEPAALDLLRGLHGRFRVERDDSPFNYSALNNRGVARTKGEYICLLNNDIEVLTPDWIEEMLSFASRADVGAVGARLWYPDGRLQHGGIILGIRDAVGHAHRFLPRRERGYLGRAVLQQSFSAVTGACLMVRKSLYQRLGGLDESLAVTCNDVDFCLRVREAGYRTVWTPYAEMIHNESATRGLDSTDEQVTRFEGELRTMAGRWRALVRQDPAYSPNLTLRHEDFSLAWPPRM